MLAGCSAAAPAPAPLHNEAPAPAVDQGGLEVTFERTECFGTCPTYRVKIHRDGRIDWHGTANVRVIGDAYGVVDRRKLGQLEVALELARFYERDIAGQLPKTPLTTICTDRASVKIEARAPGHHNAIDYDGCQKDVDVEHLVEQVEDIAGTAAWR
ncbi:MAG TPA: DUF6438 domain-containing protein [Kofleriaceae bacterium]|nr:DUF6438 domain-containing protein [Kofleriaceae bacterium]